VRDRTQFAHVRYDHFVTQFLKLLADPNRVRARFHRDPHRRQIGKPLLDSRGTGTKPAPAHYFSIFVKRAVMAPDVPKIDPDRHPDLGASEWYFRDEVPHRLFHGK
jgi:hypothetical protein